MNVFTHLDCAEHLTGDGHPEQPARLAAALAQLDRATHPMVTAPQASIEQLSGAHPRAYVEGLLAAIPEQGSRNLDPDTVVCTASGRAARLAAGAVCAAVDQVMEDPQQPRAFCAVRPPGHHAEEQRAMGFCLFNNIAVGARHAQQQHGLQRVAILDFDVHHGNGTQDIFAADASVLFASSHQYPLYPFSGQAQETGCGNVINVPLAPLTAGAAFLREWRTEILPRVRAFAPQLILLSAGFDGHIADPLAQLNLTEEDFAELSAEIVAVAEDVSQGRIVSLLEGGYDLQALGASVAAHVEALA